MNGDQRTKMNIYFLSFLKNHHSQWIIFSSHSFSFFGWEIKNKLFIVNFEMKHLFFIPAILCLYVLFLFIKFYVFNKTIRNECSSLFFGMINNWIFITIWDQNSLIYLSCFVHYLFYYCRPFCLGIDQHLILIEIIESLKMILATWIFWTSPLSIFSTVFLIKNTCWVLFFSFMFRSWNIGLNSRNEHG